MRRKRQPEASPSRPTMDTDAIRPMSGGNRYGPRARYFVKAVLFGTGELRQLERASDVFGLVLAGYEGHLFGDDGTYTALAASELSLERWNGVRKLEYEMDRGLREINPAYRAMHVGFIALDEAAAKLDIAIKHEQGVDYPSMVSWQLGSFSTGGTLPAVSYEGFR